MKGRSAVKKMDVLFILLIAAFLVVFLVACTSPLVVGDDIKFDQISDFYYTIDASTNPPFFLRYCVYTVDGVHTFYHEERSGDHWPLTDNDATVIEKREMTEEEWDSFCKCIADGTDIQQTVLKVDQILIRVQSSLGDIMYLCPSMRSALLLPSGKAPNEDVRQSVHYLSSRCHLVIH